MNGTEVRSAMLDQEDLKWIATTSTELNSMLQQISRYSDLARQHKGQYNYIEMLGERVQMAARTAQELFDRVTSSIIEGTAAADPPRTVRRPLSVLPEPAASTRALSELTARAGEIPPPTPPPPTIVRGGIPPEIPVLNPKGRGELILLVDDEIEVAQVAGELLTAEDYKVVLAKDGFEALKIYQQIGDEIGLIILDFFLPIMDGDAVFDELRALNPNVNVVLSSGFAEQSKLGAMLSQGLRGFIPKPYTRKKLLDQLRSILDSGRNQA